MARVPDLKRLTVEDFPKEDQGLVSKIAFVVNSFHEQVRSALNKSINFDNLDQQVVTLSFLTNDQGQPLSTQQFRSELQTNVRGILPISINVNNNQGLASTMPVINFTQNENLVSIPFIGGLQPETRYSLTLLLI